MNAWAAVTSNRRINQEQESKIHSGPNVKKLE